MSINGDIMRYGGNDLVDLAEQAMVRPSDFGWWGDEEMFVTWGWSGILKHRDSNLIEISNFDFISHDLMSRYPDDYKVVGVGHWAVGHLDQLTVRVLKDENAGFVEDNITEAFEQAMVWVDALKSYAIACEHHYSALVLDEVFNYSKQILPDEIYINVSVDDTVGLLLSVIQEDEYFDYDNTVPCTTDMYLAAYNLGLCDYNEKDFWDEFVLENNLPTIKWDDITFAPKGLPRQIDGQLSFDDISN